MQTMGKKLCFLVNDTKAMGNTLVGVGAMQTMLGQVSTVAPFRFQTPVVCTIKYINYSQIDLATGSEEKLQYVLKMCQNGQKC